MPENSTVPVVSTSVGNQQNPNKYMKVLVMIFVLIILALILGLGYIVSVNPSILNISSSSSSISSINNTSEALVSIVTTTSEDSISTSTSSSSEAIYKTYENKLIKFDYPAGATVKIYGDKSILNNDFKLKTNGVAGISIENTDPNDKFIFSLVPILGEMGDDLYSMVYDSSSPKKLSYEGSYDKSDNQIITLNESPTVWTSQKNNFSLLITSQYLALKSGQEITGPHIVLSKEGTKVITSSNNVVVLSNLPYLSSYSLDDGLDTGERSDYIVAVNFGSSDKATVEKKLAYLDRFFSTVTKK